MSTGLAMGFLFTTASYAGGDNNTGVVGPGQTICQPSASNCWSRVFSTDLKYHLDMEANGNLVLRTSAENLAVWASNTIGSGATIAVMDPTSGRLILKDGFGNPKWSSPGAVVANTSLIVQPDANAVIYAPGGGPVWATATAGWQNGTMEYHNGWARCNRFDIWASSGVAAIVNNCILATPANWTLYLEPGYYQIDGQFNNLIKKSTLSKVEVWRNILPGNIG